MESNQSPEESFLEWDNAHEAMQDEVAAIQRLENRLTKVMAEAAFAEFPELKNMSGEQFRKFDDRLGRAVCDFAREIANFAYGAEQQPD